MMDINKYMRRVVDGQFRSAQWNCLSPADRLNACQQLENRLASERNAAPRQVVPEKMKGRTFGYQAGDKIYINAYLLDRNEFLTNQGFEPVPAAGWQTYDTVCHEDVHGMREDMKTGQTFTYINDSKNYDIYRIQTEEKYAFAVGQYRTLTAIMEQKEIYGLEMDMIEYKDATKSDRYQDRVAEAAQSLGIPNIERELEQLIADKEQGRVPTTPSVGYMQLDNMLYGANHLVPQPGGNKIRGNSAAHDLGEEESMGHYQ